MHEDSKISNPCHVGIHWLALNEYSQMSTHVQGFAVIFHVFASICVGQIIQQQHDCMRIINRVTYRYLGTDRNQDSFRKEPVFYRFVENRY